MYLHHFVLNFVFFFFFLGKYQLFWGPKVIQDGPSENRRVLFSQCLCIWVDGCYCMKANVSSTSGSV